MLDSLHETELTTNKNVAAAASAAEEVISNNCAL